MHYEKWTVEAVETLRNNKIYTSRGLNQENESKETWRYVVEFSLEYTC
jgi:hypothetical protein